jgi:hypothetical protein
MKPRFKSAITDRELQEWYSPTAEELAFAETQTRSATAKVGLLVLLKTFQRLGYCVTLPEIPRRIVERIDADQWRIPEDFEKRAAAYDSGRNRQANIRILSAFDLEKQIGADGATWLDRRLIAGQASDLAPVGFGQQVRDAMDRRRENHIDQGDATRQQDGRTFYRRNLLARLRDRDVARAGAEMAASKAMPFRAAGDGETVSGKFAGTIQLSSGKFAVVEKSHEFTLVPWRPVIDRQLGREVAGVVQGGSVSWQLGRQRGMER